MTSFNLDCQHYLLRETEGLSNQDTFRSCSHKIPQDNFFSLIPAVKVLFLSDPHDCSTRTKFLTTCKTPSLALWGEKEPLSLFGSRGLKFCKGDCPHWGCSDSSREGSAQSGLVKHHSHNQCKRLQNSSGADWGTLPLYFQDLANFLMKQSSEYLGH